MDIEYNPSSICFGCEALGGTDWGNVDLKELDKAIHKAVEMDINFFDTADVYGLGLSEERLSKILGHKRLDLFIATKGGVRWTKKEKGRAKITFDSSPEYVTAAAEKSLKRLQLECLPLYYIHWPDPKTPIEDTLEAVKNLQEKGKVKHFGLSNVNETQLCEAQRNIQVDYVQIPINIMSKSPSESFISHCNKSNTRIVGYNVLNMGLLSGKFTTNTKFDSNDRRSRLEDFSGTKFEENLSRIKELKVMASARNQSLIQYSINSVLDKSYISSVIVGIKNEKQLLENLKFKI